STLVMATVSARSQPLQNRLYIYKGLPCNSLMAGEYTYSDRTPLHEAACQGRLLHLMTLMAQGFQVNTLTLDGVSPLHEACLTGRYACARVLLDNGANAVSADGATPLSNSCSSGNVACVRLLLQHGASVHPNHQLASPIHQAAKKGHRECLELLLSSGAQIDFEVPNVGTPLYVACRAAAAECVELLLRSGADVGSGCGQISPLHAAVCAGEADVVQLLLDFGADRASRNAEGKTPLDLSAPNSAVRFALQRRAPCSLSELSRFCVRRSLGRPRLHKTSSLFLPRSIKNFLLYK
uniref:Ankyrin repeat and SOCS box protein 11 n=1 Tax=Poecilia latipinna TaxID=48699 RepID=A0A3B3VCI9_9TELE